MRKKILACLLALSVVCNSGSVAWAFGSADEEVEVFDSGETAGEVITQEETEWYGETETEDEVEVFQENEQPESEPAPLDGEVTEEDVFGNDTGEPVAVFSDAEPVFGDSAQLQANVASAGTLEVGQSVTLTGDADGNAAFTFKVAEEGIYKLKYSEWMDMSFAEAIPHSYDYDNNFCVSKFAAGSYSIQCSNVAGEVTVTAEKLPDIVSIEVASCSPETFYRGEEVVDNIDAEIKITKSDGTEENTSWKAGSSYGGFIMSYSADEISYYFDWERNIKGTWIGLQLKDLGEDDPKKINIDSDEIPISSGDGRYYFQFTPSQAGEYKITYKIDKNYEGGYDSSLFKVTQEGDKVKWDRQYPHGNFESIVAELEADTRYIVRIDALSLDAAIPVKVEKIVGVQSFELADGQELPAVIVNNLAEISSDTKFKIQYTDTTSEEISFEQTSAHHGRIDSTDKDGYRLFFLMQDSQNEKEGHFVKGPKVIDLENAIMNELTLNQTASIPCSEIYLDGAYFKFQATEASTYEFQIKNAGRIQTSLGYSYNTDGDEIIRCKLAAGESVYFAAREMTADVEATVNKMPPIKSITLKDGKLDGETFIRGILVNSGEGLVYRNCTFEVEYTDGTSPETVSFYEGGQSKYYGNLYVSGIRDEEWNISAGDRQITFGFDESDIRTPAYTIHIVERPSDSMITKLTAGQEQPLKKGAQNMQWFSFRAGEAGTYHFNIKADREDITRSNEYFLAKEPAKAKALPELVWNEIWGLEPIKLEKGETLYVGISGQEAVITAKAARVGNITEIKLADGETLSDKYISEFLWANTYLPQSFEVIFEDNAIVTATMWEDIELDGINYGQLQCEWPQNDEGEFVSGELKVYVGNSLLDGVALSQDIIVGNAVEIQDLPQLAGKTLSTDIVNYNNAYCFVYEAETAGIHEITFTPNGNESNIWNNIWQLKGDEISSWSYHGGTSFVRQMEKNEKLYFMYQGEECKVSAKKTEAEIKALSVNPTYSDILYGHYCRFNNWEFRLEVENEAGPEPLYSADHSFERYGAIGYTLGNGQNFNNHVELGATKVKFYLTEFPGVESNEIDITVKKGSDMGFSKLPLDQEVKVEDTTRYADYHSATFVPEEDGLYEYKIKSWFQAQVIDDDGYSDSLSSNTDNVYEGVFEGRAGKGYTFLVEWPDGAEIGENTILITKIDKTKLQTLYNANKDKSSSGYTTHSWNAFAHALEEAEAVLENESALQREIDKAYGNLDSAIKGLTYIYYPPSVDKSSLRQLYDACSSYKEADYTAQSWKVFQEAMTAAKSALDNSYSQSTVDDAEKKLKAASDGLVKAADKKALQEAYDKYKTYEKDDYTEMTWMPFEKALSDAGKGLDDKDLTTEKAAELLDALEKAAAGLKKVGVPIIKSVKVSGNKATVQLNGKVENAEGYDFVIGTGKNCISTKKYNGIRKNITALKTDFKYVQKGTYYAYCHAWKKVDGKKIFGGWSEPFEFTVTATTPVAPKIKSVSVKGKTVTVVFEKIKNVKSYDVVLGKTTANDSIYGKRPVNYGKLVKKSKVNTIVFRNVKKGTYYLGAHAANFTGKGGKKIFGKWSGAKRIIVK